MAVEASASDKKRQFMNREFSYTGSRTNTQTTVVASNLLLKLFYHLASWCLILLALFLLRLELTNIMGLSWSEAWQARLGLGIIRDMAALSGLAAIVWLLYALMGLRQCFLWSIGSWILFLASLANLCYFRVFGCPLELWAVLSHFTEALDFFPKPAELQSAPLVVAAMVAAVGSTILSFMGSYGQAGRGFYLTKILPSLLIVFLFSGIWYAGRRLPVHFFEQGETILTVDTVSSWYEQVVSYTRGKSADYSLLRQSYKKEQAELPVTSEHANWPQENSPQFAAELRQILGLPAGGPVNLIVIYLNTWRSFELLTADTAAMVVPKTTALLGQRSINFTQAYSSAVGVGQHEQAVMSTMCSRLPNNVGPAAMVTDSGLDVACLQQLAHRQNYRTAWLGGFKSGRHGLHTFELLHGSDFIFDTDYFEKNGITEKFESGYLADGPFLAALPKIMGALSQEGRPLFVQITTAGAAYPYTYIKEGELSPSILDRGSNNPEYLAYLSRLRYSDEALAAFFDQFFQMPMAENSLVVLVGNHGSVVNPYHQVTNSQMVEIAARVPLALVTKNMPRAAAINWPVHQLDIAPTLAKLLGAESDKNWFGQGLFSPVATSWAQLKGGLPSFRILDKACYSSERDRRPKCYDLEGHDPLLTPELKTLPVDGEMLEKVRQLFVANGQQGE